MAITEYHVNGVSFYKIYVHVKSNVDALHLIIAIRDCAPVFILKLKKIKKF